MARNLMVFDSDEEAENWGFHNLGKYGTELVKVGNRYVWLCGTSMADDMALRSGIENAVIDWINGYGLKQCFNEDPDQVAIDLGAELTTLAYESLAKWYDFDVIYCSDSY